MKNEKVALTNSNQTTVKSIMKQKLINNFFKVNFVIIKESIQSAVLRMHMIDI